MSAVAVFRCDASPSIGGGHVMRCLTFAETLAWAGWSCRFATKKETITAASALMASGHEVQVINDDDTLQLEDKVKLAIVDAYALDGKFERQLAARGRVLVAFDDLADRSHACDILLDPTPRRRSVDYAPYLPAAARILLGPCYAMIARKWCAERLAARARLAVGPEVKRILVSMGATDPTDATSRVLAALAATALDVHVDVVLSAGAPHIASVAKMVRPGMTLHIEPDDLPSLAEQADLAIGAPATSAFERALLGLPAILVPVADNQRFVAAAFAVAGAAEVLSVSVLDDPASLAEKIIALAADSIRRARMSMAAAALTDGRGAQRLLAAIAGEETARHGARVRLRLAEAEDETWLLNLQRQPATRRNSRNPAIPTVEEHARWFHRLLDGDERILMIVEADAKAVGMIRLDKLSGQLVALEISVAIDERWHGRGFGKAALTLVRRLAPGADLVATVLPENSVSLAMFRSAGYQPDGRNCYRSRAA